jgi:TolB protein
MYDDQTPPDYHQLSGPTEEDIPTISRIRNCLFLAITIILVITLAGSSVLTYIIVADRHDVPLMGTQAELPDLEPRTTDLPSQPPVITHAPLSESSPAIAGPIPVPLEVNRIVFVNRDGQIETISPDGVDRRILSASGDNRSYIFPAWSSDGRRLAVIGSNREGSGIFIFKDDPSAIPSGGQEIYYSANETPFYLYWSPDSTSLAFLANHPRNTIGLNIVDSDGRSESRLLATGSPLYWDWAGSSRQLLIHSGQRNARDVLAVIDLDENTQTDNLARPGTFQAPGIGPEGQYWAYAEEIAGSLSTLAVLDSRTGERRQYDQAGSLALSWSPTRNQIAFTNGAVNGHPLWGPLYLLDVASGETRTLTRRTVIAFFWSPDGQSIAFVTLNNNRNDDDVNVNNHVKNRLVSRMDMPVQQPDRGFLTLSIVDVASGRGLRLLDFVPTPTFVAQFLPYFDQYALSHRIWSPDSSAIVLPVREDGMDVILIVPTSGGRPFSLAEGDVAFWSHQ